MAARINIYLKNGKIVDFESANFKIHTTAGSPVTGPRISSLEYYKKDKGVSLLYCDVSEIAAITRDTSGEE